MMRKLVLFAIIVGALVPIACSRQPSPTDEVVMHPATVGEKTELYEVVSATELKLAPGVRGEVVDGHLGKGCAMLLRRANGGIGGYMECGCMGATQGNCVTTNDNPEHASCSGGCTDSEGNPRGCSIFGPLIGPPKDPALIRFRARK